MDISFDLGSRRFLRQSNDYHLERFTYMCLICFLITFFIFMSQICRLEFSEAKEWLILILNISGTRVSFILSWFTFSIFVSQIYNWRCQRQNNDSHVEYYRYACCVYFITLKFFFWSQLCKTKGDKITDPEERTAWLATHKDNCHKNYNGSSGGMEAEAAKVLWGRSLQHGLRYTTLIGDGDSKTYNAITTMDPYPGKVVKKAECVNHVAKRWVNESFWTNIYICDFVIDVGGKKHLACCDCDMILFSADRLKLFWRHNYVFAGWNNFNIQNLLGATTDYFFL